MAGHSTSTSLVVGIWKAGDDMKGVILTARAYEIEVSIIRKFTNLGGANPFHLVQTCFEDEGPGGSIALLWSPAPMGWG
jgi:hypothetical protein